MTTTTTSTPSPAFALGSIDITPTWLALMPAIIAVLQDGTPIGRQIATAQLIGLAKFADDYNAKAKGESA